MEFPGFEDRDFAVFSVLGLEARMEALIAQVRPKLGQLGRDFSPFLSELWEQPVYAHVAKHARRTVNPPNDTWVAFCPDKRGYKKHPHFQIGLWETHVFATFGLIYESPLRMHYARQLRAHAQEVLAQVPKACVFIPNHMDPAAIPATELDEAGLVRLTERLEGRQGELLVGLRLERAQAVQLTAAQFEQTVRECFLDLKPLLRLTQTEVTAV